MASPQIDLGKYWKNKFSKSIYRTPAVHETPGGAGLSRGMYEKKQNISY
jgi:hypothetical protein